MGIGIRILGLAGDVVEKIQCRFYQAVASSPRAAR
jgi:hypothetical protein